MRRFGVVLGSIAIALVAVSFSTGQAQQKKFGGGFGFGGFGGGAATNPLLLLNNEQVKKELDLTQEQIDKVPEALDKALGEVLNEKQQKRFRQIRLQTRGNQAFTDAKVAAELKITEEQKTNISTILEESRKEQQEIFKEAQGGNFQGIGEKVAALNKETTEKVQNVLTSDQRKQWKQMIGAEFKLEAGGFGGFGKKKKDAE